MTQRALTLVAVGLLCAANTSCQGPEGQVTLQGAGATFPAPLYKRWFLEYYRQHPEVRVNFQPIGSGAGIRQFIEGLIDFGASDAAMSDKEIDKFNEQQPKAGGVQLLPATAGAVALSYNIPGGVQDLRLSREALLAIFLGKIDHWNDSLIAKANPSATLPDLAITAVRRSEGSGTTYCFTNHLSVISEEWKKGPGVGKTVVWPVGIGAKGNSGVAALIQQTPGAIGYIEAGYAELTHMPMAAIENKAGQFVLPHAANAQKALGEVKVPDNLRMWVPDPAGQEAYPIVTYTWLLCRKHYDEPEKAAALKKVFRFCLTDGQKYSQELGYVPLPDIVAQRTLAALDKIGP
jgi:phosphate transport system substrate-binding protein